ncbi:MAG: NAD(P)H-hydrate dehydratase [Desulfobacterales bacterium]|nr:NAD(P)H-hydrate dehydratase [Desulfobacterales bacterium]
MLLVTARQMQGMDHHTIDTLGIPGLVLMENAGRGAFDFLMEELGPDGETLVAVVAGRGNNGGDGFVIARYLMEAGIPVTLFLLSTADRLQGDARTNYDLVQALLPHNPHADLIEIPDAQALTAHYDQILDHDLFVDAIFGTGLNSDVRGFYREVIQLMNASGAPIFSVDIPSGLNADTGQAMGISVEASATATFAHAKAGHVLHPGNAHTGELAVIDIGIPGFVTEMFMDQGPRLSLMETEDILSLFPDRPFNSHKGSFGHLLALAGAPGKTGAAILCARAAQRCGTGLVTLGVPEGLHVHLEADLVEPMTAPLAQTPMGGLSSQALDAVLELARDKNAIALGPGLGTEEETRTLVKTLVKDSPLPLVLDADGLNNITDDPSVLDQAKGPRILTPHPGEMARLTGKSTAEIQAQRPAIARDFAQSHGVVLVLKGAQSLVALPDGSLHLCPTGNPGMAAGGMGDVLTGMIGGFLAQGFTPENAALAGVFLHGMAGDYLAETQSRFGFLASELADALPLTLEEYL